MTGEAEIWFAMIESRVNNLDEFKNLFLKKYWEEIEQGKVREEINFGKYRGYGNSRENYAIRLINKAQQVEPKYSESELVNVLGRHFERDIKERVGIEG